MQHILPAALARDFNPDEPRDEGGRWTDGGGGGSDASTSFISPNVSTLTFDEAVNALNSDRQKQITAASNEIDDGLGIKSTNYPAIGAWSDGAENSMMVVSSGASTPQVRAASAMKGYIADQKAVLVFHPSGTGQNFLASFDVEGKAGDLHDQLLKDDLSFHTLQPLGGDRFRIHVFGSDQATIDAVHKAATDFGAAPKFVKGDGEFIGTTKEDGTDREQRDDARQKYQEVIDTVAVSSDVAGRNVGAFWRQVRDRWSESEASGGTSKHAGPGYPASTRLIDGVKAKGFSQLTMRQASIVLPPALFKKYYGAASEFFAANAHLTPRNLNDIVLVVRSEPLYVHRDLQNVDEFTAWATSQGFDEIDDDLHVTVLYSKTAVDWDDLGDRDTDHLVVPAGGERTIEVLGDGAVALVFASTALARRHGEMLGDGASSDYDAYVPHVTINTSGMIPDDAVPYDGELIFGPEIFETIVIEKDFDELETRAGKKTVVELWPKQDEPRNDFMSRCIDSLTKCVGPKKAPRICATKWRKSEKLGKKPADEKAFIARGLDDADAIEACGETCVGCKGADAPFDKAFDPDEPRDEGGKWTEGGGGGDELGSTALSSEGRTPSTRKVDALRNEMGITEADVPFEQRQALDMYTQGGEDFNQLARLGPGAESTETQNLDKLVGSYKLPSDVTVYRTVGWQRTKSIVDHLGDSFSDPGFMSTTLDKSKVEHPGSYIEIQIPKGSHAFPVGSLSQNYPEEAEILFPRNSRLQIISHEPRDAPNTERLVARLVS